MRKDYIAMPWLLLTSSCLLGAVAGFVLFSNGRLFNTFAGNVAQGVLSIACFALIFPAFLAHGWKIGLLDLVLTFLASNVGVLILKRLEKFT